MLEYLDPNFAAVLVGTGIMLAVLIAGIILKKE